MVHTIVNYSSPVDVFEALADPTRRQVVQLLGRRPHRAGELADAVGHVPAGDEPAPEDPPHRRDRRGRAGPGGRTRPDVHAAADVAGRRPGVPRSAAGRVAHPAPLVQAARRGEIAMTTMTEVIDVDTDPLTAFTVFTDEFDQWWGRGPIDAHETWRLVERRIEGGVGGRLVEDYGDEERVTGTITIWEPGARLAWSTRNDVTIDVTFEAHAAGTRVRVTGTVPDGVDGTAQLSMVRMAPQWLPRHLDRRARGVDQADYGRLHLVLRSSTPAATARWLVDAFGLEPTADIPDHRRRPGLHLDRAARRHLLRRPLGRRRSHRDRLAVRLRRRPRRPPAARRGRRGDDRQPASPSTGSGPTPPPTAKVATGSSPRAARVSVVDWPRLRPLTVLLPFWQ